MRISNLSMHRGPSTRQDSTWRKTQAISLDRSARVQSVLVSVLTLAALALLGLVLAYWTWVWLAPRPEPRAQAAVQGTEGIGSADGLFGSAPSGNNTAAPTGIAIRLLGIVAATPGHHGYAAVQLGAKEIIAVREGENVAPGIVLAEVSDRQVILERGGVRETLALPEPTHANVPETAPETPPATPPSQ
jgi:general secretion pathway protein C